MKPLAATRLADAMGIGQASAELWVSHVNTALQACNSQLMTIKDKTK